MKSLSSKPVLWFLFSFNLLIAVALGFHPVADALGLSVTHQIAACGVMGVIALGAGAGAFRKRPQTA